MNEADSIELTEASEPGFFRRAINRVNRVIRREEARPEEVGIETSFEDVDYEELIFAYHPAVLSLHGADGDPKLPDDLIPICRLKHSEHVNPETLDVIKGFSENQVGIKIFSAVPADQTVTLLRDAGGEEEFGISLESSSGSEMSRMSPEELADTVKQKTIFGELNPLQSGKVVEELRGQGDIVAVLGDGVSDVPALRQADVAIAFRSSSQAVKSVAYMILLEDSPLALQRVLDKGQRIVSGLLDILKLSLTQVIYLVLLILAIRVLAIGFPYKSAQGSIIVILTITIPSIAISL
ncbi:MAG: HAD family hydrolase [Anaerolineales bacterium]|nr:HAD family hydrolase [Anaerolineales bacterium]